jgi:hypothetical protein
MEVVTEREAAAATSKAVNEVLSVAAGGSGPALGLGGGGHRGGEVARDDRCACLSAYRRRGVLCGLWWTRLWVGHG